MKLSILLLMIGIINISATGYSQKAKFNFNEEDIKIIDVFSEIEANSDFRFFYIREHVDVEKHVSLIVKNANIEDILLRVFEGEEISYEIKENNLIILRPSKIAKTNSQQDLLVSGKVTDSEGKPLPGVNVYEKGTTVGTVTDLEGNYKLPLSSENATIVFSFIGYLTEEIQASGNQVVDVILIEDVLTLEEVVVIGYGNIKKADLTGAVSTVEAGEMQKVATTDIGESLQGRASGVMVSKTSGEPGSGSTIKIRGINSINSTNPLWVVDGVKGAPVGNMDDIESVSVLKDAASTSIYGKDGANGVIIVTTKRGIRDKVSFQFRTYNSWNVSPDLPEPLSSNELAEARITALRNGGTTEEEIEKTYGYYLQDFDVSTNWGNELQRTGGQEYYYLSASGGSEKANFFISGNFQEQKGTVIESEYNSYNFKVNSDMQLTDWLKVGESVNYKHSDKAPLASNNIFEMSYRALPMIPVYDESNIAGGGFGFAPEEARWQGANPVAHMKLFDKSELKNHLFMNVYAEIEPIESLTWRTNVSGSYNWDSNESFRYPYYHGPHNDSRNQFKYKLSESTSQSLTSFLTFDKEFGLHSLTLMQGMEAERSNNSWIQTEVRELKSPEVRVVDATDDPASKEVGMNRGHGGEYGYYGRLNYGFDNRYLFQANYRLDYSAKFGPANSSGFFPSFSLGWRLSEEEFLYDASWISNLKIRGGWGLSGIDNIDAYQFAQYYSQDGYQDFGGVLYSGSHINSVPNESIKWEEIEQLSVGIDYGLFDNRISGAIDFYDKITDDMLISVNIPQQTSFNSYLGNRGVVKNSGVDIYLSFKNDFNGFVFNISGNANYNKNEVIETYGIDEDTPNILFGGSTNRTVEGRSLASFYGYIAEGLIRSQDELDRLNGLTDEGTYYQNNNTQPGDILFKDIAGVDEEGNIVMEPDGRITEADQTFIGSPWPDWYFGFHAGVEYRNFDLSISWTGQYGNDLYNETKEMTDQLYMDGNTSKRVLDSWSEDNPTGSIPRLTSNDQNENFGKISTYFLEDGSYLRLKNLQIGYTLPKQVAQNIHIENLRFYVSGTNLLTFTSYSGLDPEFVSSTNKNAVQGVDSPTNYPQYKSYTVGLQLDF